MTQHIAVIGAGLSGLIAARELTAAGHAVRVFEKARGPGGRMSTRRRDALAFDHGAQYFTVRDDRFATEVRAWERAGIVQRWDARLADATPRGVRPHPSAHPRYVGVPRMSAIARHLSTDLDVVFGERILALTRMEGRWHVRAESGELGRYDAVLVTCPPEQAVPLLASAPELAAIAAGVRSEPCWAVMAAFDQDFDAGFDGAFVSDVRLSWVARNSSKPGRPPANTWVLHATPAWSRRHQDDAPEEVSAQLLDAFWEVCELAPTAPTHVAAHRWLLSQVDEPLEAGALWDAELAIGAAGDWCHGGRVEGAALSGLKLAERMQTAAR